jgi:hypothetical protein
MFMPEDKVMPAELPQLNRRKFLTTTQPYWQFPSPFRKPPAPKTSAIRTNSAMLPGRPWLRSGSETVDCLRLPIFLCTTHTTIWPTRRLEPYLANILKELHRVGSRRIAGNGTRHGLAAHVEKTFAGLLQRPVII